MHLQNKTKAILLFAAIAVGVAFGSRPVSATVLYYDSFESYPLASPAPSPLTNGPAGGQWYFVVTNPPILVNQHRIAESFVAGGALNSRAWYSASNYATISNAISLSKLGSSNSYTYHLSFVVASDTFTVGRNTTFGYSIASSSGTLTFLTGTNLDNSQTLPGLSGTGLAASGTTGKSANRQFNITFQGSGLAATDSIYVQLSRITNDTGALLGMLLDDVQLTVDDNSSPTLASATTDVSLSHVQVSFSEPVDPATATTVANYTINNGVAVSNAYLIDPMTVLLFTSDMTSGTSYTVGVSNVLALSSVAMTPGTKTFTAPQIAVSPVRYDAGTTTTLPAGPLSPTNLSYGYWAGIVNNNAGMSASPVLADNGTQFNAWNVTDQNSIASGGSLNYTLTPDVQSRGLARTNGWRLVLRSRMTDNFGGTAADQLFAYSDSVAALRFGLFFGVDINGNLFTTVLGGSNYVLTSDVFNYHTHELVYDPKTAAASYYFDGQLIVSNYPGQSLAGVNGLTFGSANSTGTGSMDYNLVQMDVVGASAPAVVTNPANTTNAVGQQVTFTSAFTPFVNGYLWTSNGVIIPGATASSYTTPFITMAFSGTQYACTALSAFGNATTAPATLTVSTNTTPPSIVSVQGSLIPGHVIIRYSEPVLGQYATNPANYTWTGGITTTSITMLDPFTVELAASPVTNGSYYTIKVSNIHDTSNLIITTNSPATFFDPQLIPVSGYSAGDQTNQPAGPYDPVSAQGGSWNLTLATDVNLSTNAVVNDSSFGLNAWQVRDASTIFGDYDYYTQPIDPNLFPNALDGGFLLTVVCRLPESFNAPVALFAQVADQNSDRLGLSFMLDQTGNLIVGTSLSNSFVNQTVISDGTGSYYYHTHQLYYNPKLGAASYYMDGTLVTNNLPWTPIGAATPEGLLWGALSSAGEGTLNLNQISFAIAPYPFAAATAAGGGPVQIAYRGILQSTTNLQAPIAWTSLVTNTTVGTNYYTVTNALSKQFFRSQMP